MMIVRYFRATTVILFTLTAIPVLPTTAHAFQPVEKELTYWQDIQPILRKNCAYCHATRHLKKLDVSGGLALDSYDAVVKGGKKHPVMKVGDSKTSLMVQLMITTDVKKRMPLDGKPLPGEQIDLIKKWIDTGAKEGKKPPEEDEPKTVVKVKTRKLNVSLLTQAILPKGTAGSVNGGPLALNLKIGPLAPITAVTFSPDNNLLATGYYGQVSIWDLNKVAPVKVLTNVLGAVNDLAFSPDGKLLVVAGGQPSAKGELRIFQVSDWKQLGVFREHTDVVYSVAFSPDGMKLAAASFDSTITLWDIAGLKQEQVIKGHSDFVYAVAFHPNGKVIASVSKDRTVRLTDLATGKALFTMGGMEQDIMAVAFNKDGKEVVTSGFETQLYWWNTETGEQVRKQAGHGIAVHELTLSKDGQWVLSAGADKTVRIWDGKSGAPVKTIPVGSSVYAVALSPNKKWIASGSFDGLVRLWEPASGKQVLTLLTLPAEEEETDWLAFTPAGFLAASTGVTKEGNWTASGGTALAEPVWKALHQPALLTKALQGGMLPTPSFGK
jgi:WD40 repeat protein